MSKKNYLNMHVLISHSPSCLNRDDANMQKSATFGGKRRVRISSQSQKRAVRTSDYYREVFGEPSIRTRELSELRDRSIAKLGEKYSSETITKAIEWISNKDNELADNDKVQASALAPWAIEEIAAYAEAIEKGQNEGIDEAKLKKQIVKESEGYRNAFNKSIDIALSGRMATSGLMTSIDGALAVAHSITTHTVDADIDWFTAVDDLIVDEGDVGAAHLNTQEFSSGVFYRYISANLGQLQKNLGDINRDEVLRIAKHLVHLFATVVPNAKQQSFAAHNLADVVLVNFSDIPISLANAFEEPVTTEKQGGYLKPSAGKLFNYWNKIQSAYRLDGPYKIFNLTDVEVENSVNDLQSLEEWIETDND